MKQSNSHLTLNSDGQKVFVSLTQCDTGGFRGGVRRFKPPSDFFFFLLGSLKNPTDLLFRGP